MVLGFGNLGLGGGQGSAGCVGFRVLRLHGLPCGCSRFTEAHNVESWVAVSSILDVSSL